MEATETKSSAVDKLKSALPLALLVGVGAYLLVSAIITAGYLLGIGGLRHRVIDNRSAVEIRRYRGTERDVIIPSHLEDLPVTRIRADAFYRDGIHLLRRMRGIIDSVTIPNTVTYIGSRAFMNNWLAYVTIPDSVTYIGRDAFSRNRLTSITIPDSVAHYNRGFALLAKEKFDDAIADFEAALRIDPHNPYTKEELKYACQAAWLGNR